MSCSSSSNLGVKKVKKMDIILLDKFYERNLRFKC